MVWWTVAERASEGARAKSAHMRSISKGRASTTAQMRSIEREVIPRLTMVLGRAPFDSEIDAEVAKEYQRQQAEKQKLRPDYASEIEEVRSRVTDLESNLIRIEENLNASNKRIEDMMRQILHGQSLKQAIVYDDVTKPSSSTKLVETSTMTSTTTEALTALQADLIQAIPNTAPPSTVIECAPAFAIELEVIAEDLPKSQEVAAADDLPNDHRDDDVYSMAQKHAMLPVPEGVEVAGEDNRGIGRITATEAATEAEARITEVEPEARITKAEAEATVTEAEPEARRTEAEGVESLCGGVSVPQIEVPDMPSTRPRRATKATGSKGPTPKPAGLPKPPQAGSSKKGDAGSGKK